jgi:ABC-type antimicrobial peptide transport system permease subunit
VIAGAALSMAASRLVSNVLFDVAPTDLISIAVAITSMVCVSGLPGFLPARRASRLDPIVALQGHSHCFWPWYVTSPWTE